ncbi:MAG: PQQ-dependent sugar dehydrogenase [Myxococcota bacterium]|nr:PQQ-dependent sugar dehydrogenase [Myxococcota bacterium]
MQHWLPLPFVALLPLGGCIQPCGKSSTPSGDPVGRAAAPVVKGHQVRRFEDLPPPFATPSKSNPPLVVERPEGATLHLPPGFRIQEYASGGFQRPRWCAVAPNGDVLVSDAEAGTVTLLRGIDANGRARERRLFAAGLMQPFGLAFAPGFVYVGGTDAVVRIPYEPGDLQARGPAKVVAALPGQGYHEHWTRNVLVSRDFKKLYVTVGSTSNDDPERDPERAAVLEMNLDGTGRRVFASGTRNPVGLAWRPATTQLWAVVEERDGLGDDLVPDYFAKMSDGAFYGWPFAYLGPHEDPLHRGERPDLVAKTRAPELLLQAHVAVLGLVFYEGAMFPADWRGDAILALHGSWNRSLRVGYELVRVRMQGDGPLDGYDEFVTGWMSAPDRKEVWGRPVGLSVLPDGSMLVVDDAAAVVWRITYTAAP